MNETIRDSSTIRLMDKLKEIKPRYEKEGVIILGIFGSYAKNSPTKESDIDILYDIEPEIFCKNNPGFKAFCRLNDIKEELSEIFSADIDLATADNHNKTFRDFALKSVKYVK